MIPNFKNITVSATTDINCLKLVNPDNGLYEITISTLVAKTYNELLKRLIAANWETISLNMKNGDNVTIEAYIAPGCEQNLQNTEWFLVHNPSNLFMDSDNLVEVAAMVCDYEQLLQKQADEKKALEKFFQEHLNGHSAEELEFGNKMWLCPDFDYHNIRSDSVVETMCKKWHVTKEYYLTCVNLSENWSNYSDWYKSVYQVRPQFTM